MRPSVLALVLAAACAGRNPDAVRTLAEQAESDPRKVERLVGVLKSPDEATWRAAYGALVSLRLKAVPALERAVQARHAGTERALLALGEMGEPSVLPFLHAARGEPDLKVWVDPAWELAERTLAERLEEDRSEAMCDAYLEWFPNGDQREEALALRRELQAEQAWADLGDPPSESEIRDFLDRWDDTRMAVRARRVLAGRLLAKADRERAQGRTEQALAHVGEAREVDPTAPADTVEASIRAAMGRVALAEGRIDDAVEALGRARKLGGDAQIREVLQRVLEERARAAAARGAWVPALRDLDRAVEEGGPGAPGLEEVRRRTVQQMIHLLDAGGAPMDGLVEALAEEGPNGRRALEPAIASALDQGDASLLERAMVGVAAAEAAGDGRAARAWGADLLERAASAAEAEVRVLLNDSGGLENLLACADPSDAAWLARVEAATRVLRRYLGVASCTAAFADQGGAPETLVPSERIQTEAEVTALVRGGHDGRNPEVLPRLARIQVLGWQLDRVRDLPTTVGGRTGPVAAAILSTGSAPFDVPEWARVLDASTAFAAGGPWRLQLLDDTPVRLAVQRIGTTLRLQVLAEQGRPRVPEPWVGHALSLLLVLARPVLAGLPDVERFEVSWTWADDGLPPERARERIRLAMDRPTSAGFDWAGMPEARPLGRRHLRYIPGAWVEAPE
ncbi:MAG: tetratricopeptide repeat protein [Deltaproteobacteria bacterium]|nr:tetratricopeptide repeat protein [Deltaproteobacteria bacterium]